MADSRTGRAPGRRAFFSSIVALATGAVAYAWGAMGGDRLRRQRAWRVSIVPPAGDGVAFHEDVIVVTSSGQTAAFSTRCPHLGCRISWLDRDALVCPCHGSRFDLAGQRLGGLATEGLRRLNLSPAKEPGKIDIDLAG